MAKIHTVRDLLIWAVAPEMAAARDDGSMAARYADHDPVLGPDEQVVAWVLDAMTVRSLELLTDFRIATVEPEAAPDPETKAGTWVARRVAEIGQAMPAGSSLVAFVIIDQGDQFESAVVATLPPDVFAPVVRAWLKRYDAGKATGMTRQ